MHLSPSILERRERYNQYYNRICEVLKDDLFVLPTLREIDNQYFEDGSDCLMCLEKDSDFEEIIEGIRNGTLSSKQLKELRLSIWFNFEYPHLHDIIFLPSNFDDNILTKEQVFNELAETYKNDKVIVNLEKSGFAVYKCGAYKMLVCGIDYKEGWLGWTS